MSRGTQAAPISALPATDLLAEQALSSIPGVAAALVGGHCCLVAVNSNIIHDPATIHMTTNAPITTNTCKYTQTSHAYGASAPDNSGGVYAVDSSLGVHVGSNADAGLGAWSTHTTSAEADAGVAVGFTDSVWNGWSIDANLFWHIRGTIDAQASGEFGQGGKAAGSVYLNMVHVWGAANQSATAAMSASSNQDQNLIDSVSRDYNDNVMNNNQLSFTVQSDPNWAQVTDLQLISETSASADVPFGTSGVTNDFASGDPTTRSGPQAWSDYIIWHFTPPPADPGWYVTDCGPS